MGSIPSLLKLDTILGVIWGGFKLLGFLKGGLLSLARGRGLNRAAARTGLKGYRLAAGLVERAFLPVAIFEGIAEGWEPLRDYLYSRQNETITKLTKILDTILDPIVKACSRFK